MLHVICTRLLPGHLSVRGAVRRLKKSRIAPFNAIIVVYVVAAVSVAAAAAVAVVVVVVVVVVVSRTILARIPNDGEKREQIFVVQSYCLGLNVVFYRQQNSLPAGSQPLD